MVIDSTFWVAVSFFLFFGGLIYLKVPQKINQILNKLILDIKNEIDESEKLRTEAKTLLDKSQIKLESAQNESEDALALQEQLNASLEIREEMEEMSMSLRMVRVSFSTSAGTLRSA